MLDGKKNKLFFFLKKKGHDTRINFNSSKSIFKLKQFSSYKFKFKNGIRTQVLIDLNRISFGISESLPCKEMQMV
jgi:hypothetical protein